MHNLTSHFCLLTEQRKGASSCRIPLTLSQATNFRRLQMKEFAEDNFKFDENGRTFSKWVENTVGKAEIARYEQFLLFPLCFQQTYPADT